MTNIILERSVSKISIVLVSLKHCSLKCYKYMCLYICAYISSVCKRDVYFYNMQTFWFHFCATELFLSISDGHSRPQGFNGSSFAPYGNLN